MKHLRKYNESKVERLDHDYIKDCFVDLIDKGFNFETELDRPDVWNYEPGKIPLSIINDIPGRNKISKYSLEKVAIKYELNHEIVTDRKTYYADNLFEISVIFRKYLYGE